MPLYPFQIDVRGYKKGDNTGDAKRLAASLVQTEQGAEDEDAPLLHELKRLYTQYFSQEFEPKLPNVNNTKPIYPALGLFIDEGGYDLKLDFEFLEQLFDIYIVEGWAGVEQVQSAISLLASDSETKRAANAAGTQWPIEFAPYDERAWRVAHRFFLFSRNLLAILITDSLQKIEKTAAENILQKISVVNVQIAKAWTTYQIKERTYTKTGSGLDREGTTAEYQYVEYSMDDKPLAADLYQLLTKVVNESYNFNEYAQKNATFRKWKMSSLASARQWRSHRIKRDMRLKSAAGFEAQEIKYKSLAEATKALLARLQQCFSSQHPLGVLVAKFLERGFEQTRMEHVFGLTLNESRLDLERLATQIDPLNGRVGQAVSFTGLQSSNLSFDQVLAFKVPKQGIEFHTIDYSLYKYKNPKSGNQKIDLSYLPLLSEEILTRILDEQVIEFDTFDYVVATHYVRALLLRLNAVEQEEAVWENFWKSIGKVSAALSLASLATPVTAEFAPFLRGASAVADLAMLAHAVGSVSANLQRNENLIAQNLVATTDETSEVYSMLGEVLAMKKEYAEGMNDLLAQEFFNLLVGQRLPIIKELLVARGYYYDLETLSEDL